uniref:Uncharacterized protein n=1 Tax=Arundo donax TaxID=35708 RepID=A0A0A9CTP6_ARUDO
MVSLPNPMRGSDTEPEKKKHR